MRLLLLLVAALVFREIRSDAQRASHSQGEAPNAGLVADAPTWENGPPQDESYFPIGVWLQNPTNAARFKRAGINLYVGLWRGPTEAQLAELEAAGMPVICSQNPVALQNRSRPIIVGWMHGDEPDNAQPKPGEKGYGPPIKPEVIAGDYARVRAADPTRPVLLNLGQGVAWDNYIGRGVRRNHPEDYPEYLKGCDIASFDIYPAVHDHVEVAGKLEFVAKGVSRLDQWSHGQKLIWNCIECTHISNPNRQATPAEVRSEVWLSLIHGSRGLIYFVHQFKPVFKEAALLDDPEMLAAVTAINREIRQLAPVLNSPNLREGVQVFAQGDQPDTASNDTKSTNSRPICWNLKQRGTSKYLLTANATGARVRCQFTLGGLPNSTAVEVLGEARRVTVQAGQFSDDFAPYQVHLYTVALP